MEKLAIFGGPKTVKSDPRDVLKWPIVNKEMEDAVVNVLRAGNMSGCDITKEFEGKFAAWHGRKYGLGANTGTAALQCAMYAAGVGYGDEIICPSITYWASCLQVFALGGTVVFADIDPETLCLNPVDIEQRITDRTKAIMVVHYCGHPADMDKITAIARKHKVKVIEDVSHAHGALYKGKIVGSFGDAAGFSLMSGKSFAVGEAGIMLTDDREMYERACAFGYYERGGELTTPGLAEYKGLPFGGHKYRMHQMSSAVGLEQLKKYPSEMAEIDQAMNYFWDLVEGQPGIKPRRPAKSSGTTMGGWYVPLGHYRKDELGGLSITRFCEALSAEGFGTSPGCNKALHLHPLFHTLDIYHEGKPTRIARSARDVREGDKSLPIAEGIQHKIFHIPYFKKSHPQIIEEYAAAVKKVVASHKQLLKDDQGDPEVLGNWGLTFKL